MCCFCWSSRAAGGFARVTVVDLSFVLRSFSTRPYHEVRRKHITAACSLFEPKLPRLSHFPLFRVFLIATWLFSWVVTCLHLSCRHLFTRRVLLGVLIETDPACVNEDQLYSVGHVGSVKSFLKVRVRMAAYLLPPSPFHPFQETAENTPSVF